MVRQFLKQNLISSHRLNRLCNSLHLSNHSAFVTRDGAQARQGRAWRKEGRKRKIEEDGERASRTATSRKRQRVPRDYRLPSPVGQVDTPGTPRLLFLRRFTLFLLTSSSPLSTSIRVLNTRRKRKTAQRPRHWLLSLYFVSTRASSYVYIGCLQDSPFAYISFDQFQITFS